MVMPKQKPIVDTQKIIRNECKHTTIKTKQEESKRRRKEQRNYKTGENSEQSDNKHITINN